MPPKLTQSMRRRLGLALLALSLAPAIHAADLLTLYRDALANNPGYAAARADLAAARELLPQARGQLLPNLGLNAGATRTQVDNDTVGIFGNRRETRYEFTSSSYGLTLNQPLYRRQLWAQLDQARAQIREAEARFAYAGNDLALKLVQAYFDALLARDNLRLIAEQKTAIEAQLAQAKRLYESGYGTVTEVNEAQARLDSVRAQEIAAVNTLEVRLHGLNEITGRLPKTLLPLGSGMPLQRPDPERLEDWIEFALERNPVVRFQQARLEIAQQELAKARAGHHPTLDLVAGLRRDRDPGYTTLDTRNEVAEIGLRFNLPLYQGGQIESRGRQTLALLDSARSQLEAARRQVAQQTRQEYLNVVNGVAQVGALEQALKSHELALYSMEKGFKAGVRTSVDILNQQQLLYTAKRDLLKARYDYLISRMKLKTAAGLLEESDIEEVNGWLVEKNDAQALPVTGRPTVGLALSNALSNR